MTLKQAISRLKIWNLPIKDKQIVSVREYTIIELSYSDGSGSYHRVNHGFNAFELMGILNHVIIDLHEMHNHPTRYKTVTRKGINKNGNSFTITKKDE